MSNLQRETSSLSNQQEQCGDKSLPLEVYEYELFNQNPDYVVLCKDKKMLVHKEKLIENSNYFKAMFSIENDFHESHTNEVDLKDLDPDAVRNVLDYMYTKILVVKESKNLLKISHTAVVLQVDGLFNECIDWMCRKTDLDNCIDFLEISTQYSSSRLKTIAICFILKNFSFIDDGLFLNLNFELMRDFVSSPYLIAKEEKIFEIIIKWIEYDTENSRYLEDLIEHVKLYKLSKEYWENQVLNNKLITDSTSVLKRLLNRTVSIQRNMLINQNREFNDRFYVITPKNNSMGDGWSKDELIFDKGEPKHSLMFKNRLFVSYRSKNESPKYCLSFYETTEKQWIDDIELETYLDLTYFDGNIYYVGFEQYLVQYSFIDRVKKKLFRLHVVRHDHTIRESKIIIYNGFVYVWFSVGDQYQCYIDSNWIVCSDIDRKPSKILSTEVYFELKDFIEYDNSLFLLTTCDKVYLCNTYHEYGEIKLTKLENPFSEVIKQFNSSKTLKVEEYEFRYRNSKGAYYYQPQKRWSSEELAYF